MSVVAASAVSEAHTRHWPLSGLGALAIGTTGVDIAGR